MLLPLFILLTWCCWHAACVAQRRLHEAQQPTPPPRPGHVSLFPGIPLFPLMAWGLAAAIDLAARPWGTRVVFAAHGLFLIALLRSILRDRAALNACRRSDQSPAG